MLSLEDPKPTGPQGPLAKAKEYAERAEYMYISPEQAMVSALLALFWLRVAEIGVADEIDGIPTARSGVPTD